MGHYDPRDPETVAKRVHDQLMKHWESRSDMEVCSRPKLIISQGDPVADRGISAITPRIANMLGVPRGLVVLDPEIAAYHSRNADRTNVILECKYNEMVSLLEPSTFVDLEKKIDELLSLKNEKRKEIGKSPLKDYFRDFALLQEVTKAACRVICGDVTVAHTARNISEFSVTSFYEAGLELGLLNEEQMVPYEHHDELDFEKIDKR